MVQSSLGALQADNNIADAAAHAEDSEQHSSESDLTPSRHSQQQQQVGQLYCIYCPCTQIYLCRAELQETPLPDVFEVHEGCDMCADSVALCAAMRKVYSQTSRHAEPWPLWLAGMHDGSAFCMR